MNKIEFKLENLKSWYKNTEYWLTNPLRQVVDTNDFFKEKLKHLVMPHMSILDMGCGSAWLLDFISQLNIPFTYKGIDFNEKFIYYLSEKYSSIPNASFEVIDVEVNLPNHLINKFDIVFNCFNFFEATNLDVAFENAVKMLKNKNSKLVILTIDVTYLILGLSHNNMAEFKRLLNVYEEYKVKGNTPSFFQNIDLGHAESSDLKYASVLYSFDDYFKQAKRHNLHLEDYGEIVKTSKFMPKTYQYIVFK